MLLTSLLTSKYKIKSPIFFVNSFIEKRKEIALDFIIDKLTNSIENVITGGEQRPLTKSEAEAISEYIKAQKAKREKKPINRTRRSSKKSRNKITT